MCDDKNCQSTKCIHKQPVKSASKSSHMQSVEPAMLWSVSKPARKRIGTQREVTRNCQDFTSKQWYPSVNTNVCPDTVKMQSSHMWPVKADCRKSQVNTRSQVQTSKSKRDTKPQA